MVGTKSGPWTSIPRDEIDAARRSVGRFTPLQNQGEPVTHTYEGRVWELYMGGISVGNREAPARLIVTADGNSHLPDTYTPGKGEKMFYHLWISADTSPGKVGIVLFAPTQRKSLSEEKQALEIILATSGNASGRNGNGSFINLAMGIEAYDKLLLMGHSVHPKHQREAKPLSTLRAENVARAAAYRQGARDRKNGKFDNYPDSFRN